MRNLGWESDIFRVRYGSGINQASLAELAAERFHFILH
jgi:hypothetical protein